VHDNKIEKIFKKCVRGTAFEAVVRNIVVVVGILPGMLSENIGVVNLKVYVTTRVFKHLYDRRPAEEFDFVLGNISEILAHPDCFYKNKNDKRGQFCIMRRIGGSGYFASLEVVSGTYGKEIQLVTAFRIRSNPYLNEYDLLWSRRDGATHSS
jgi:hypothetical protein